METWIYWRWDDGNPPVYRTDRDDLYAKVYQRWDPRTHQWVDMRFGNSVSDYIYGEGGAGIVRATEAEIAQVTGGTA